MAENKTCKCKRKPNCMHEQLLFFPQLVNENKVMIKGRFGVGITSKTEGDTFLKVYYHQIFLKCLRSEADCCQEPF